MTHPTDGGGAGDPRSSWATAGGGAPSARTPSRRARGLLIPLLTTLTVVLLLGAVVTVVLARRSLSDMDQRLAALQIQQQEDAAEQADAQTVTPPPLDRKELSNRLAAVRAADKTVDSSATTWRAGRTELKIVWEAVGQCMYTVDQYNRMAGWFSAEDLGDLPPTIDLTATATDCGKAMLAKNSKGAGF